MQRHASILVAVCLLAGCGVKRMPAAAGPERNVRAGERVLLGKKMELPEGTQIAWSTGDGNTLKGDEVTHFWDLPGEYRVEVTVTDADGQVRSDSAKVTVERPAIMEIFPVDTKALLVMERPSERLADFPLFLERLLVSGREANAVLAAINEFLGFDPFDRQALEVAGIDPAGSLAVAELGQEGFEVPVVVAAVFDRGRIIETAVRIMARTAEAEQRPSKRNRAIIEVVKKEGEKKEGEQVLAAYSLYRGYLWVAFTGKQEGDPAEALAALRAEPELGGMIGRDDFKAAAAVRPERGALHLFLPREFLQIPAEPGSDWRQSTDMELAREFSKRLDFFRADLEVDGKNIGLDSHLGLSGEEAARLASVCAARNEVPSFGSLMPAGQHILFKLSADLFGMLRELLTLGGMREQWNVLMAALDAQGGQGGGLRKGLLENMGDSYLVGLKLKVAGLVGVALGGKAPKPQHLFDAVALVQLRDGDGLTELLGKMSARPDYSQLIRQYDQQGRDLWEIGSGVTSLTLAVQGDLLVVATSRKLAVDTAQQATTERQPPAWWPACMAERDQQVLFVDFNSLLEQIKNLKPGREAPSVAFLKAMLLGSLGKFESLGTLTAKARLGEGSLGVEMDLSLR